MSNDSLPVAIEALRVRLLGLPRIHKRLLNICSDITGIIICAALTYWICAQQLTEQLSLLSKVVCVLLVIGVLIASNAGFGLYRSVVRFMGTSLFIAALKSTSLSIGVLAILGSMAMGSAEFLKAALVMWALVLISFCSTRFIARSYLNRRTRASRERAVIYGAGSAGSRLANALAAGEQYVPVAFVDDSRQLWGQVVGGLEVYPARRINRVIADKDASLVLLALPSIGRKRKRKILERLIEFPVHVQTVPEIADIVSGHARVDDVRDVEVEDLLGREEVPPNSELLGACVSGKVVMVTGAGGSIGSELCRQILMLSPRVLILFEVSEVSLYQIDRQLRSEPRFKEFKTEVVPLLGSVHHRDRVTTIMRAYGVQTVYHAAAYKHVPLVEQNIVEGIHNNAFGTLHTAKAAADSGVETFVLISTDKAVSPTNVMGATKRFAELVLQAMNYETPKTRFCMVRFGNVLASSGSVVPLFKEQIRNGGPVTVTHPEIIRYFMTIPEAAQLVIQAGSMALGGDVFVLDMGKPVKIVDLARRMIHLMGLTVIDEDSPDGDIEIEFTGLRPAEKLYEELLIGTDVSGTEHPRILRANEGFLKADELNPLIDELREACRQLNPAMARKVLIKAVEEYAPGNGIEDIVWCQLSSNETKGKVTPLAAYRDQ